MVDKAWQRYWITYTICYIFDNDIAIILTTLSHFFDIAAMAANICYQIETNKRESKNGTYLSRGSSNLGLNLLTSAVGRNPLFSRKMG